MLTVKWDNEVRVAWGGRVGGGGGVFLNNPSHHAQPRQKHFPQITTVTKKHHIKRHY